MHCFRIFSASSFCSIFYLTRVKLYILPTILAVLFNLYFGLRVHSFCINAWLHIVSQRGGQPLPRVIQLK